MACLAIIMEEILIDLTNTILVETIRGKVHNS